MRTSDGVDRSDSQLSMLSEQTIDEERVDD